MNEQRDTLSITLQFGTWKLPMSIHPEDEYAYRQAEKLIKERYNFYTSNYHGQSAEMYLVMTLIDVAVLYKKREAAMDDSPGVERMRALLGELELALKK
ncbi:MAG: cell division protein ZapA [Bacteroidaceae bacterium]|nr:cell division protein ZapA [Bacteroidaceae bacterium]